MSVSDTPAPAWEAYGHPDVRNLAWVLAAPALLDFLPGVAVPVDMLDDCFWRLQCHAYRPRLAALDARPAELTEFLARHKNHRLGYYFEYLLLFWLLDRDWHPFELLMHRATLYQGKVTIGELDFLIRNHDTGLIEHWEVAVKFYLGHPPLATAGHWLGPNARDSLGAKLAHLATQQFRFGQYRQYAVERRCLLVKGQLYYPPGAKPLCGRATDAGPACLAPAHLQGNWLPWSAFLDDPAAAALHWRHVAGRNEWLAHQQPALRLPLSPPAMLAPPPGARPELLLGFDAAGLERARCFVQPEAGLAEGGDR